MKLLRSLISVVSGVAGLGATGAAQAAVTHYSSEYLGSSISVIDMNDNGELIGSESGALFRWSFDGEGNLNKELLPISPGDAYDINNRSQLLTKTGLYDISSKTLTAFASGRIAYSGAVNDLGEIVVGAGVHFLATPTSEDISIALGKILPSAFNNNGLAVDTNGAVWDVHTKQKVASKPGVLGSSYFANDMNDKNQILYSDSVSYNGGDGRGSYIATVNGENIYLGNDLYGYDMDNLGNVVGFLEGTSGKRAAYWSSELNEAIPLDRLIDRNLRLAVATHINDRGWIVAAAESSGGNSAVYLLKPVPLPASGIFLFSSLLTFASFQLLRLRKIFGKTK